MHDLLLASSPSLVGTPARDTPGTHLKSPDILKAPSFQPFGFGTSAGRDAMLADVTCCCR